MGAICIQLLGTLFVINGCAFSLTVAVGFAGSVVGFVETNFKLFASFDCTYASAVRGEGAAVDFGLHFKTTDLDSIIRLGVAMAFDTKLAALVGRITGAGFDFAVTAIGFGWIFIFFICIFFALVMFVPFGAFGSETAVIGINVPWIMLI